MVVAGGSLALTFGSIIGTAIYNTYEIEQANDKVDATQRLPSLTEQKRAHTILTLDEKVKILTNQAGVDEAPPLVTSTQIQQADSVIAETDSFYAERDKLLDQWEVNKKVRTGIAVSLVSALASIGSTLTHFSLRQRNIPLHKIPSIKPS